VGRLRSLLRREWLSLILGAAVVTLALNSVFGARGVRYLANLRARRIQLEAQVRQLQADNSALETTVQKLRSDDRYVERLIRSELGYARADELVYRFAPSSR
jgi:cell division protein FtsB